MHYDVAIIGAGPGGSTAARLLAGKLSVLLIDPKSDAPGSFQKPCGGLLSPDAQRSLARFDLTLPRDVLVDPQIFSVRTYDLSSMLVRDYQRFYLNLDRRRFDRWLMELIPPGVDRLEGRAAAVRREADGFSILCRMPGGAEQTFSARRIIGADGAHSAVRRCLFPGHRARRYVAVQQWFEREDQHPFYSCIFDPEAGDCCSWSISKNRWFIFGGAFSPQDCRSVFEAQKERLARCFDFVFGTPAKTEACEVLRPRRLGEICYGDDGALLIGEAAGWISPSSLEGISWAFDSARAACDALLGGPSQTGNRYRKNTRRLRLRLAGKLLKTPVLYDPLPRRLIMRSGLRSIRTVSDARQYGK